MKYFMLGVFLFLGFIANGQSSEKLELDIPPKIIFEKGVAEKLDKKLDVATQSAKIQVYNRWGELLYTTSNFTELQKEIIKTKKQPEKTLFYLIEYTLQNQKDKLNKTGYLELG